MEQKQHMAPRECVSVQVNVCKTALEAPAVLRVTATVVIYPLFTSTVAPGVPIIMVEPLGFTEGVPPPVVTLRDTVMSPETVKLPPAITGPSVRVVPVSKNLTI